MKQKIVRTSLVVLVLAMALSLSGCIMNFSVVGDEDLYTYDSTGLIGPALVDEIKVIVAVKGFIPSWPDLLTLELSGAVEPVNPALANVIEQQLHDALSEGDSPFYSVVMEDAALGTDSNYRVTAFLDIPEWQSLIPTSASTSISTPALSLSALLGAEAYDQLETSLMEACSNIPLGTSVSLTLDGTLDNTAKNKVIGTMLLNFMLNGSLI